MNSAGDMLDPSLICLEGEFDMQVENLLCHVRLTAPEVKRLRMLFDDLALALQPLAPGLQIVPFGSIVTGLGIKGSDVDCHIVLPNGMHPYPGLVIHARNILRKHFGKFTNLFAIANAKVPIVKFLHIPTNCNCDVNFKSPAGVQNSKLIGQLLNMDSRDIALKLAVIIKYWSKVHKLTGTNLLASYSLTLMVIFYLQVRDILPSIKQLQDDVPPYMLDNWNTAFSEDIASYTRDSDESLYDLLTGFFKYYASLNFENNIICPYLASVINRSSFKKLANVPPAFELYEQNVLSNVCKPLAIETFMCVQDPFEHSRNTAGSVHVKLGMKIRSHFQFGARMANELPPEEFLAAILIKDTTTYNIPPTKNKASRVKQVFQNKVKKAKFEMQQTDKRQKNTKLQNNLNITTCYQQIRNIKRHKKY